MVVQRRSSAREQYRAHVREQIRSLGRSILAREGEAAVTMTRLAEEMGLSVGSIYRYFPSRGELLSTLWHERIERLAVTVTGEQQVAAASPRPGEVLHVLGSAWTTAALDDSDAVHKLAEVLERAAVDDPERPLPAPGSVTEPLIAAVGDTCGLPATGRAGTLWRTAVLLRVIAVVAARPPFETVDAEHAARTVSALLDAWIEAP